VFESFLKVLDDGLEKLHVPYRWAAPTCPMQSCAGAFQRGVPGGAAHAAVGSWPASSWASCCKCGDGEWTGHAPQRSADPASLCHPAATALPSSC
jgi:hypothetical protein